MATLNGTALVMGGVPPSHDTSFMYQSDDGGARVGEDPGVEGASRRACV